MANSISDSEQWQINERRQQRLCTTCLRNICLKSQSWNKDGNTIFTFIIRCRRFHVWKGIGFGDFSSRWQERVGGKIKTILYSLIRYHKNLSTVLTKEETQTPRFTKGKSFTDKFHYNQVGNDLRGNVKIFGAIIINGKPVIG